MTVQEFKDGLFKMGFVEISENVFRKGPYMTKIEGEIAVAFYEVKEIERIEISKLKMITTSYHNKLRGRFVK
jgi:hypothetical protein